MIDLEIVEKPIKKIDIKNLTIEFLVNFYLRNTEYVGYVLLVYDGDKYMTAFSQNNANRCMDEADLREEIVNLYYGTISKECIRESELEEKIKLPSGGLVLVAGTEGEKSALFLQEKYINLSDVARLRNKIKETLRRQGVSIWTCKIPGQLNLKKNIHFHLLQRLAWADCYRKEMERILPDYMENDYDTIKQELTNGKENLVFSATEKPILYLIGPCIVGGNCISGEEDLALLLKQYGEYEVCKIVEALRSSSCFTGILKKTIRACDIVIFVDYFPDGPVDFDLTNIFTGYKGKKKLYMDAPLHTTKWGNQLLASYIVSEIIEPHMAKLKNQSKEQSEILHIGEPCQLSYGASEELERYLDKVSHIIPKKTGKEKIAAIVMNANPFTLGHRYLVECAAKEADILILFVVEEDASEFPFKIRKKLVELGTSDLKNVTVVPSGNFVISRSTFINYFQKENIQNERIDASFDCGIFALYIAPGLGISKRFVGEEPFDAVTRQYNEQMKEILPKYGLELVEIPRRKIEAREISATRVRALYKEKQWEDLKKLVPHSTFSYLRRQAGKPWESEEEDSEFKKEVSLLLDIAQKQKNGMKSLDEFLKSGKRLVVYGIGSDGDALFSLLPNKLSKNIVFCDKKAIEDEIWFHGRKVISPECIMGDDLVYIATRKYAKEVYRNLLGNGIEKSNIGIVGKIEKDAAAW